MDKTRALKVTVEVIERTSTYDYLTAAESSVEVSLPVEPAAIGGIVTDQVRALTEQVERLRGPLVPSSLGLVSEQGTRPV